MSLALWITSGRFRCLSYAGHGDIFRARPAKPPTGATGNRSSQSDHDESLLFIYPAFTISIIPAFRKIRNLDVQRPTSVYGHGMAEAAFISNESYQDLAAAQVIVQAAGGDIYKMDGRELTVNEYIDGPRNGEHLLVASPATRAQVLSYLQKSA
jgi:myo-inositol-1(or 4)-monophosphatase